MGIKKFSKHLIDLSLPKNSFWFVFVFGINFFNPQILNAACGGTARTWDSGGANDNWSTAANWSGDNIPNGPTEDAVIIAGTRDTQIQTSYTIGCFEVQSGLVTDSAGITLTIAGDYFRNLTTNSMVIASNTFWFTMAGTTAQTFENVDSITNLEINNNSTVTLTQPFVISNQLLLNAAWTGTLYVNSDLNISGNNAITVPAGATVIVNNGAVLTTNSNWTVNGTLKIMPGAQFRPQNGRTLTIGAAGTLIMAGADGSPAVISPQDYNDTITVTVNGRINAEYFRFSSLGANGLQLNSIVQKLDNGDFQNPPNLGRHMTWGAAASFPTTLNNLGFMNGLNVATVTNINASAYNVANVTINNWTGSKGGATFETDGNNRIAWGSQGTTKLVVTDTSNPPASLNQSTTGTGATFAFSLNQAGTSTNITQVVLSMIGTASTTDIASIQVYRDVAGSRNCVYNAGVDTAITAAVQLTGSPPSYTVNITPGDVATAADTDRYCIHVRVTTSANARDDRTIQFAIQGTSDVTNSQSYGFATQGSPPVISNPNIPIVGDAVNKWEGSTSTAWATAGNWTGAVPLNSTDCEIGVAQRVLLMSTNPAPCQNATLKTGGTMDFNNTTNNFDVYSELDVETGFTFSNSSAGPANIRLRGTSSQTVKIRTEFPGNVTINNTGAAGNETVAVAADSIIGGTLTITNGTLQISSPNTLTVRGNITCQTGANIIIAAGATLALGNNATLDIQNGCSFTAVGASGNNAKITSDNVSSKYVVTVANGGTIAARYYTFTRLGTNGLTINATSNIDATNHLQDGTFTYPVNNTSTFLRLARQIPTNTLNNMTFSLGGSGATGTKNIDTTGAGAGTLTLDAYSGDLGGPTYDTDPTYLLSWLGAVNTINLTQEATGPATLNAGNSYVMGRYGFQQTLAGASYVSTDITSLKLTLTGTASASDVSEVRIYYDSNCDSSGGVLIGSGTYSGSPAIKTFAITSGQATVQPDNSSPPKMCIYVEHTMAPGAVNGNTIGVKINASTDLVNSQSYALNATTQPPISLGTAGTIVGSNSTQWIGGTSNVWTLAGNWSAGVPDATKDCYIDDGPNDPVLGAGTYNCKSIIIGNGTLTMTNGSGAILQVSGSFSNSGTFTQNNCTLRFIDDGVTATNQGITSSSTIPSVTFAKTAGGEVFINSTALTITTLNIPASQTFTFRVPNGKTLTLGGSPTLTSATFSIEGGGTVVMPNGSNFTVGAASTLRMVGSAGNIATLTASGTNSYNAVINGTIAAQYYRFDHLAVAGVAVAAAASIDSTYHLQNGVYACPRINSATLLSLARQVPTNTMDSMEFKLDGCAFTGTVNVNTAGAAAGTLTISNYSGDVSGPNFDAANATYPINWTSALNTLTVTATTAAGGMNAGTTYLMGRYNFTQAQAGSFPNMDITSLKVTLTGTATASDIDSVNIYYETDCNSAGGTLIGSGTLSGSPASRTFTISAAAATVDSHATTPPTRCIYVEYAIAGGAVNGNTAGAEISLASHLGNDQGWNTTGSVSFPLSLGTARSITGATVTTWTGATNTTWATGTNWSSGVPDSTKNCIIDDVANDPVIGASTACKQLTINSGGSVTVNTGFNLDVHDNINNSGTITLNGTGALRIAGTGTNIITSSSALTLSFNKTSGTVQVGSSVLQINGLTFPAASNFTISVPDTKTLLLNASTTLSQTVILDVNPGGTLKMANATTLTVNTPATLKMVGTAAKQATMTSNLAASAYNVIINTGSIEARYYTFDHLGTAGVSIESGATINATNHLQDGNFTYPVNNTTTLLYLKTQVPTNTMNNMNFDTNGGATTAITNVNTTGAAAGTLTINAYIGDRAGPSYDFNPTPAYAIAWTGALNTIDLGAVTGPASVDAGSTYVMGRFTFVQSLADVSYVNTDISSLKLTATGTASSSDIDQVRIYYETDCNSSGGALIGSGTFSGSPLVKTFAITAGDATIPMHATTPPTVCIYVEMDISPAAVGGNTIGVKIQASGDVVTSQSYTVSAGTPPPITTGTPASIVGATNTIWTGNTSTDWFVAGNWSNGVPDQTKSCQLTNRPNDPNINGGSGTARCKNFNNVDGILTLQNATGAVLEVYGNLDHTGTITQNNGTIRITDGGAGLNHTVYATSTITALTFNKTTGGDVRYTSTGTITTLTIPAGQTFNFKVASNAVLTLTNGVAIPSGTFIVESAGEVRIPNGQTLSVTGGTFQTTGGNDAWGGATGQNLATKAKITVSGAGRWAFSASSGSVDLTGFILEYLDTSGLNMSGTANLVNLDGGQFAQLQNSVATRAFQINKTAGGTITETTPTNVGFTWGAPNTMCISGPCTPLSSSTYYLVYAQNCGGAMTLTFSEWFGSFTTGYRGGDEVNTENKIYDSAEAGTCNVVMAAAASPVSLTKLDATPYDAAVSLDWETGSELDHAGFNVYRSISPSSGYIQVNTDLIRNVLTSTSFHGVYRYVDRNLVNGLTYYYKIEDVATNGAKVMHGPVNVTPLAGLGNPPVNPAGTNGDESEGGEDAGNGLIGGIGTGVLDLGNGVHILAQTQNSLRIEIIPPTETWAASTWNGSYETLTVPGYAKMVNSGRPELAERTLLIEVGEKATATVYNAEVTEAAPSVHVVAPAPSWAPNGGGVLQPSWSPHGATYATNASYPSNNYYSVTSAIQKVDGNGYLQIKVVPFLYNPVTSEVKKANKIVLDIGLDGVPAWANPSPNPNFAASPAAVEGVLRAQFKTTGMHEISFDTMRTAGVDGPFNGVNISNIRGYYHGEEIPLSIVSGDGTFSTGDLIRYHAGFAPSLESIYDEVVISSFDVKNSGTPALRMTSIDADPTSFTDSPEDGTYARFTAEADLMAVFDAPIGDMVDHLYWKRIYRQRGNYSQAPPAHSYFDIPLQLQGLISHADDLVYVRVYLRGKASSSANSPHHLQVFLNTIPTEVGDKVFEGHRPQMFTFALPSSYFFSGTNNLRLLVLADRVPAQDYDVIDIDKVEVDYRRQRKADNGIAQIYSKIPNHSFTATGFAAPGAITVYDISRQSLRVNTLDNVQVASTDGGVTYNATFAGRQLVSGDDTGRYYEAVADGSYLQPDGIFLNWGSPKSLKDTNQGADLILIGSRPLLDAAQDLVTHRKADGLRVATISLEQIYGEFSHGRVSSQGIKDFLSYARASWQAPAPKYLLLLGDSTYDPKNKLGFGVDPHNIPIAIQEGTFMDFGNDHWFVADSNNVATMAVGRLPTSKPSQIEAYVEKLIKYEEGDASPQAANALQAAFISDYETMSEGFGTDSDRLASSLKSSSSRFKTSKVTRVDGSDATGKTQVIEKFNSGPLMLTYMGHGAEDVWASGGFFTGQDASALTNQRLPIVSALNCLNTHFYDADPEVLSMGESLVLNPNGGAIVFWGSSAMTVPPVQMNLAQNFLGQLGKETSETYEKVRLGDLIVRSKSAMGSHVTNLDTVRSYTLFGDPSVKLPAAAFAPAAQRELASEGGGGGGGLFGCGTTGGGSNGSGGFDASLLLALLVVLRYLYLRFTSLIRVPQPIRLRK